MVQLSRTVRFAINPQELRLFPGPESRGVNGYAGSPPIRGLGRYYEIQVCCMGDADPVTGYLVDIKDIDRAVRSAAIPIIERACDERPATDPAALLPELVAALRSVLGPRVQRLRWSLSPYYSVEVSTPPSSSPSTFLLRQRFDFSASHRLNVPALSEDENRRRFGKCNNPSGHGHNYQFEPCVEVPLSVGLAVPEPLLQGSVGAGSKSAGPSPGSSIFTLDLLERLAEEAIIRRFDHKNLTTDCPEFRIGAGGGSGNGINATVENIARVFYELLATAIKTAVPQARLRSITVWETDRTSATYPG